MPEVITKCPLKSASKTELFQLLRWVCQNHFGINEERLEVALRDIREDTCLKEMQETIKEREGLPWDSIKRIQLERKWNRAHAMIRRFQGV